MGFRSSLLFLLCKLSSLICTEGTLQDVGRLGEDSPGFMLVNKIGGKRMPKTPEGLVLMSLPGPAWQVGT